VLLRLDVVWLAIWAALIPREWLLEGMWICLKIQFTDPLHFRFADYIEKYFKDVPNVKVTFERDGDALAKSYPLLHSVARASLPGTVA
jgi:hypothetical protein